MLGTYASALVALAAAAAVGQAIFALCGRRRLSWLAPAVGIAALLPLSWWTVRLPGEGAAALIALLAAGVAGLLYLPRRLGPLPGSARSALWVAVLALLLGSLPFIVEGRFGILGTGLNPDMSQHLFAADRLADSGSERLIDSGYPLGPHSLVVALTALGPSLVQAFGGLTLATAVAAALAPLGLLESMAPWRRIVAALLVGFAYMSAAYLTQGAFKETLEALFLLAFAIGLGQLALGRLAGRGLGRAIPLAVLAVGATYAYSFPGLIWLVGAAGAWAVVELGVAARGRGWDRSRRLGRDALAPAGAALGVLVVALVPEVSRMADFASFETFDPDGAGLGNLFNPISPLEALGVWPSGDFRLDPGAGFAPAIAFWLGALIGAVALAYGIWWWVRRDEYAVPAAVAAAAALVAYAHLAGTPYQEAKAIALAAPLAMLVSVRALAARAPTASRVASILRRRGLAELFPRSARKSRRRLAIAALAAAFVLAAGGSTLLALANGPVGPSSWSPALLELRPLEGATLVLAPEDFLLDEHGRDFVVWELRGGEVCVEPDEGASREAPPPGIGQVLVLGDRREAPFEGTDAGREVGDWTLWGIPGPTPGPADCPFIADGDRAAPASAP